MMEQFDPGTIYPDAWGALDNEGNFRALVVNRALRGEDLATIDQCVAQGWLDASCKSFDGSLVVDWLDARKLKTAADHLVALGFPSKHRSP